MDESKNSKNFLDERFCDRVRYRVHKGQFWPRRFGSLHEGTDYDSFMDGYWFDPFMDDTGLIEPVISKKQMIIRIILDYILCGQGG